MLHTVEAVNTFRHTAENMVYFDILMLPRAYDSSLTGERRNSILAEAILAHATPTTYASCHSHGYCCSACLIYAAISTRFAPRIGISSKRPLPLSFTCRALDGFLEFRITVQNRAGDRFEDLRKVGVCNIHGWESYTKDK